MTFIPPDPIQWVTIDDFSPGVHQFSTDFYPKSYTPTAPLGSAAFAYRCMVRPGVGLIPLPVYTETAIGTTCGAAGSHVNEFYPISVFDNDQGSVGQNWAFAYVGYDAGGVTRLFLRDADNGLFYSTAGAAGGTTQASNVAYYYDGTNVQGIVFDNTQAGHIYVTWQLGTTTMTTTPASPVLFPLLMGFFTSRLVAAGWGYGIYYGALNSGPAGGWSPNIFFPELGNNIGTLGSISVGETILINQSGGGIVITGDIGSPSSAINLPGITSSDGPVSLGISSPQGMLYPTYNDGVYLWNGGSSSVKISRQIGDDCTANLTNNANTIYQGTAWGEKVWLPNNWIWDTVTNSWWQCEDPSVIRFWNFGRPRSTNDVIMATNDGSAGTSGKLNLYVFDRGVAPQSSWEWQSNPIPGSVGNLVSVQAVEIVASNGTATSCTITVTPTVPTGQVPFTNQNQNQAVTFTVPAKSVGYRATMPLGYTDYNVELNVKAQNSTTSNPAPTLHMISAGVTTTRTSRVQ